jgi:uncharacterized protein YigE (DUF2233 family)
MQSFLTSRFNAALGLVVFLIVPMWLGQARTTLQPWLKELLAKPTETKEAHVGKYSIVVRSLQLTDPIAARHGLTLVFVTMHPDSFDLSIEDTRKWGPPAPVFRALADKERDFVLVNGGYFGTDDGSHFYPLGIIIHRGKHMNKAAKWTSGGVLLSRSDSAIAIKPIRIFQDSGVAQALQSKPLLVEGYHAGIRSDDRQLANRTAVAICKNGSVIVAGAFNDDNNALSLYEFAQVLSTYLTGDETVDYALNMDGGPGAHIFVPSLKLFFGNENDNYVPNVVRFSERYEPVQNTR